MPAETLDEQASVGAKEPENSQQNGSDDRTENELATKPTDSNRFQQAINSWRSKISNARPAEGLSR